VARAGQGAIEWGCLVAINSHSIAQIVDSDCIYVMKRATWWKAALTDELYNLKGIHREIFDASARSLTTEKLANDGADVLDRAS
jgi:ABC-type transport system involved in cytochrome bd biosynthesis fused ATPase/permease subunit